MMSFQQTCPSCARNLELPLEADGQQAVCPACETQFVASANTAASNESVEPAQPPRHYRSITIESIVAESQTLLAGRRHPLFLPFLLPTVLLMIGFIGPVAYLSNLATTNQSLAIIWLVVLSPLFLLPVAYASWVALSLVIRLLDEPEPISPRFISSDESRNDQDTPSHPTSHRTRNWAVPEWRSFVAIYLGVLLSTLLFSVLAGIAGVIINIGSTINVPEVRVLVTAITFVLSTVCFVVAVMHFWPLFPLLMNETLSRQVVRKSVGIANANLMTSFFLVALLCSMLGIGMGFLGLGLPLAIPIAALLVTVSFRMIEGTPIAALETELSD